jgi:hypothetical protein
MVLKALLLSLPLLFGATLSAQQQYPDLVDASTALQRITEVLPELESNLANLSEGSPEYAVAERSLSMHMHTWEFLSVRSQSFNVLLIHPGRNLRLISKEIKLTLMNY